MYVIRYDNGMSLIKTVIYKIYTGKEPFTQWLLDFDLSTRAIVLARLKRVSFGKQGTQIVIASGSSCNRF